MMQKLRREESICTFLYDENEEDVFYYVALINTNRCNVLLYIAIGNKIEVLLGCRKLWEYKRIKEEKSTWKWYRGGDCKRENTDK